MLSGTQELWFDDVYVQARRGDVWFCAMWEPHAWRVPRAGAQSLLFVFLPELLESTIEHDLSLLEMFAVRASNRPRVADRQTRREVVRLGRELSQEVLQRGSGWRMAAELGLLRLLLLLRRRWEAPAELSAHPRGEANSLARVMPALALAHRDLRGRLKPSEAADACGLGLSRFNETFRSAMGLSLGQFRRRARLAYAAHRLLDTNLAVEVIAEESGFADRSHLHHLFQLQYGCTPAAYRRRARRDPLK
jgi:AraC-like DNA-binding protein